MILNPLPAWLSFYRVKNHPYAGAQLKLPVWAEGGGRNEIRITLNENCPGL